MHHDSIEHLSIEGECFYIKCHTFLSVRVVVCMVTHIICIHKCVSGQNGNLQSRDVGPCVQFGNLEAVRKFKSCMASNISTEAS